MKTGAKILYFQYNSIGNVLSAFFKVKRESGESPGRSGHCNRGANSDIPLYWFQYEKGEGAMILKSGNLLDMARLSFRVKC